MGSEKTGSTLGTCAGGEGARHPIIHLVICIYSRGMLLFLELGWLPRHHMLLVSIIQHCDMELPSLAIDGVWLRLP